MNTKSEQSCTYEELLSQRHKYSAKSFSSPMNTLLSLGPGRRANDALQLLGADKLTVALKRIVDLLRLE